MRVIDRECDVVVISATYQQFHSRQRVRVLDARFQLMWKVAGRDLVRMKDGSHAALYIESTTYVDSSRDYWPVLEGSHENHRHIQRVLEPA